MPAQNNCEIPIHLVFVKEPFDNRDAHLIDFFFFSGNLRPFEIR